MEELKTKLKEIVESLGYYFYDLTYEKEHGDYVLRVMIENDTFISIDDCVDVSRVVSETLDEIDPFEEPYMFEVTSAGAEHELRNFDEVTRAVGKDVYVETFEQRFEGRLESFKDNFLTIKQKNKKTTKINYMDVSFIRLTILF
jgi:ribosome maturation factor RimP